MKEELSTEKRIMFQKQTWKIIFLPILLVADLPAKAAILNMNQFNAYYGCSLCLTKCESCQSGQKLYYPNRNWSMRTPENHFALLGILQERNFNSFQHQVLLGVGRTLLFVIRKKLGHNVAALNMLVGQIKLPNDFKRKARPLSELDYFKANEVKVWLLYVGPVVLRHQVCQDLYDRFYLLGFITRQLLSSRSFATEAEALIQFFLKKTEEADDHQVFSANVHSLNHLSWQVEQFGPLCCTSAMMFESANYLLKTKFTGTVNHLRLLVERYQRNKEQRRKKPQGDALETFCLALRGERSTQPDKETNAHNSPNFKLRINGQYFQADSANEANSLAVFNVAGENLMGIIKSFIIKNSKLSATVEPFEIIESFKPSAVTANVYSFFKVFSKAELINVETSNILQKLIKIQIENQLFFVPILNVFEHD